MHPPETRPKTLITSALLYSNGVLHPGHLAGAFLPADVHARFERLLDKEVLFLSGSDEYGVAITLSAELAGRTPQEQTDLYHGINSLLFERLSISFDHYSRTSWPGHRPVVEKVFMQLLENGYIEEKSTEQLYSAAEKRFLADRYVVGECPRCHYEEARGDECPKCGSSFEAEDLLNPRSKMSGSPLELRTTNQWFLRLDLLQEPLKKWFAQQEWKNSVRHFASQYLDHLRPRAITRDGSWGIPVPLPNAKGKIFYVWFEACLGYISAAVEWAEKKGHPDEWKRFWYDHETRLVQFIGKDNIFFHALFLPAMMLGQNEPFKMVNALPANEFLQLEGRQFSKSEGWMISLEEALERYSADQLRYALAANAPENGDAEFTWHDFQVRCNAELLGKYGNFANRTLVFLQRHLDGTIPTLPPKEEHWRKALELCEEASHAYSHFSLRRACQAIMELATLGNVIFDHEKPWEKARDPALRARMEETLVTCLAILRALALISFPIIPTAAEQLWNLLGEETPLAASRWDDLLATKPAAGKKLPTPEILFRKVEEEAIAAEIARLGKPSLAE